jgi:TM2 domain-containing membrane protein YozV
MSDNSPPFHGYNPQQYSEPGPGGHPPYPPALGPNGASMYPVRGYAPYPLQVAPKSPGVALFASWFIPGLGSMMNGDVGKGIGILVGYLVSVVLTLLVIGFIGVIGFWLWGVIDAFQGAKRWNAAHGIIS